MKTLSTLFVATIAALFSQCEGKTEATGKCHALAFSSGDESAAYQSGVMAGLFASLPAEDVAYDAISGISGGAVNAVILASYAKGDEKAAGARMEKFWKDASHAWLYRSWIGGITRGLFFEGGLYYNKGLDTFITK